ncbi:hypothetical protein CNQ84_11310 [Pseudomonas abyssi]|uniref:Type I restriction modification DNA specificity domain-containing protein n=1 Tax=Pseudomonas abyssi TaxID=170540 RepID=A0A2A3MI41_9PSED|nr:restriction endonuclease subunit S [Pseudomonas abyssi]PBK04214.1 hypothetical protein CNQ84_11310 [Pseudomonas abyssi]
MSADLILGYKQTEIGIIPEDWGIAQIKEVCTLINGRGFKPHEWQSNGLPIIRIQNLNGSNEFNYFSGKFDSKILVKYNQLLFAWSGSRGTSFGPHVWKGNDALLNYHTWKIEIKQSRIDSDYFFYALRDLTSHIEGDAHGASALVHTQKSEMEKYFIRVPPLESQRNISKALKDIDALIDGLDKIITKKRDIQQATMQQLLTGRRRLPGFNGEWEVKRLDEIGIFLKGSGVTRDQASSGVLPCVRYGEIYTAHKYILRVFQSFISKEVAANAASLKMGDILFAGSGETKAEIGKCVAYVDNFEAYAGGDIVILRPINSDSTYLGYALNTQEICRQKASKGQGDAVVHISANALSTVEIKLPPKGEQTAIANILSDMDNELATLENRLAKACYMKQGMMQELLTGRIRLSYGN